MSKGISRLLQMVFGKSNSITINGQTYTGSDLVINRSSDGGTVVMIDGIPASADNVKIEIVVHGDVESINSGSGNITCKNVTKDIKTGSGDVLCENVYGNISTGSGDVKTKDVAGNVSTASGDVHSSNIGGNVSTISGDIL